MNNAKSVRNNRKIKQHILLSPPHSEQDGYTALVMAADRGHVVVVQALLKAGADINIHDKVCV